MRIVFIRSLRFWSFLAVGVVLWRAVPAQAQGGSTEGKEFWLGFMANYDYEIPDHLQLFISSKVNTTATVTMPLKNCPNCTQTFAVLANQTKVIDMPLQQAAVSQSGLQTSGIRVTANDNISVFAINHKEYSTDATVVLPKEALSNQPKYIVSSYSQDVRNEFLVVATENNTTVNVTFKNGTQQSLLLKQGQTFLFHQDQIGGTVVEGCKPFAVFSGNQCATVPLGCTFCDHIVEQEYPVTTWGNHYIVPPFFGMASGYVMVITAAEDSTFVTDNNAPPVMLNANDQFYVEVFSAQEHCVQSDKPISVSQYMKGSSCNGLGLGDPAQIVLNPVNQTVLNGTYSTVSTTNLSSHYVSIIVPSSSINKVSLDGAKVASSNFVPSLACPAYAYATLQVTDGSHTLACPDGLVAYAHGYGSDESYAYSIGASFQNLQYGFTVSKEHPCISEPVTFTAFGDFAQTPQWDFGDGSPILSGRTVSHAFATAGNQPVKMILQKSSFCNVADTVTVVVAVPNLSVAGLSLGSDTVLCQYETFTLQFASQNIQSYQWQNGSTQPTFQVSQPGIYSAKIITKDLCQLSDTVRIDYLRLELDDRFFYCINGETDSIQLAELLDATTPNATHYLWQDGDTSPIHLATALGWYFVTVSNQTSCTVTDSVLVDTMHQLGTPHYLPQDTTVCLLRQVPLDATTLHATDYLWTGRAYLGQNIYDRPTFIASFDETYTVTISNPCGEIFRTIDVHHEDCGCHPFVPNAFTPNADGQNDRFSLALNCEIFNFAIRIFDRWGNLIYTSTDYAEGWDGSFNGQLVANGVYVWQVTYDALNPYGAMDAFQLSGDVTVMR